MTLKTTNHWVCDNCGRAESISRETPEGWQYVYNDDGDTRHACQRACAKAILMGDLEETLDRWYPVE